MQTVEFAADNRKKVRAVEAQLKVLSYKSTVKPAGAAPGNF